MDELFGEISDNRRDPRAELLAAARERILVLDGAMGTQIQGLGFGEDQFRGQRFGACACHQQGNNDLLILTQPAAIEDIHFQYAMAGADSRAASDRAATRAAVRVSSMGFTPPFCAADGSASPSPAALAGRQRATVPCGYATGGRRFDQGCAASSW